MPHHENGLIPQPFDLDTALQWLDVARNPRLRTTPRHAMFGGHQESCQCGGCTTARRIVTAHLLAQED